jgi:hypothetical protein
MEKILQQSNRFFFYYWNVIKYRFVEERIQKNLKNLKSETDRKKNLVVISFFFFLVESDNLIREPKILLNSDKNYEMSNSSAIMLTARYFFDYAD